jgi:hypothetical protein
MARFTVSRAGSITYHVEIDGARETARAFSTMSRTAQKEVRDESARIADSLVPKLRGAAAADGAQSALLVPTVKSVRAFVPTVRAGGPKSVGRQGEPAGGLIFSSEFGQNKRSGWYGKKRYTGSRGRQWHPHRGRASYWFFRTIERNENEIYRKWFAALDRLLDRWGAGG